MPNQSTIRIFISSPSDVRPERLKAEQIVARLDREFAYHFHVEAVLWEREPLVASKNFQDPENIPQARSTDIVVVILWSRLGVTLPPDKFRGAISGRPVTGTEWEFEDALAAARENRVPDLLLYRKTAEPVANLGDRAAVQERLEQLDRVEDFIARWFLSADHKSFIAASHTFANTAEFEQMLYEHLRALLERRAVGSTEGVAIRWHDPPFRALSSYEYEHAPVFFGRTRARNELRELLEHQISAGTVFVLVFGASGSGKSSLVKAGLLPDLALPGMIERVALVRRGLMRPSDLGGDVFAALAAAIASATALPELAALNCPQEHLAALLRQMPKEAGVPIGQGLAVAAKAANLGDAGEARIVLVIDQFEEIFTNENLDDAAREGFIAALGALAKSGSVWIVATMRSDFFDRLEKMPSLAALSAGGRYLLLPPDEAEIGQIIRQPAQEAGLRFERNANGIGLDTVIRQAAERDPSALPLLSFLLDQLWQKRSATGVLTFAAYEELGGLQGAIGRRAEEVFQAQPETVQKALVPLLRALVTVEGGKPTSRAAPLSQFPEGTPRRELVKAFLRPEARLLISDSDGGRAQLRLVHEALLTHWPRARDQVAADGRDLELRGRLEQEAVAWQSAPKREKSGRLRPAGLPLAEARALLARWGNVLPAEVRDYIDASRHAANWRRVRHIGSITVAAVAVPAIAVIVWAATVWWNVRAVEAEMKFVHIPAGCFEMGSPIIEVGRFDNEGPEHRVCLKPFDLGQNEVTQGEWRRVMVYIDPSPSQFNGDDERPVESVSWDDVQHFLTLMSLFGSRHYRLPSETEWEYAARAGTTGARYWGELIADGCKYENMADETLKKQAPDIAAANCNDGYANTAPVGSSKENRFKPNPWKLYDMLGNVAEWVADCYEGNYLNAPKDNKPYSKPNCSTRVVRGGSWSSVPRYIRAARRYATAPYLRSGDFGFRLARGPVP